VEVELNSFGSAHGKASVASDEGCGGEYKSLACSIVIRRLSVVWVDGVKHGRLSLFPYT
jgi:hypothetical protein